MDKIVIEGGVPLKGRVEISGAKNAVLPVLACTLLTSGKNKIRGVPRVRDVNTMIRLLEKFGAVVDEFNGDCLVIDTSGVNNFRAPYDLVSTMRASCLVMGPLLARLGQSVVSLPGGCAIGARPIDLHLKGFETLGATIELEKGYVQGTVKKFRGASIFFDTVTVTGTANLMMAAVLAEGETILENSAREPEVTFLADVLNQAGAKITGHGTDVIRIQGVSALNPLDCKIFPDRIELGTYMIAAAITGGEVEIVHCNPQHVNPLVRKLQQVGVEIETGKETVRVKSNGNLRGAEIQTLPYPGFPTDLQAQFMALMTNAKGQSIIRETVFENRFMHVAELRRMGADISIDGHTAIIRGIDRLSGAPLMATDLRASASLVLAALAAQGESVISRVYHIDRGYEMMEKKMSQLGAKIRRVK